MDLAVAPAKFDIVFVLIWEDAKLPLVLSQTFDQAQKQMEIKGNNRPDSVSVWILSPFRVMFIKENRTFLMEVQHRCPDIKIKVIGGINRLKDFPSKILLSHKRKRLQQPVVFHFRSESSILFFSRNYRKNRDDIYILDVRGYWPAELLYSKGVEDLNNIPPELLPPYLCAKDNLKKAFVLADGVITVSKNLASVLEEFDVKGIPIHLVPCCVNKIANGRDRNEIRKKLSIKDDEKLLVYSGGYARYQHLEDLTIPFLKLLLKKESNIKVLILSQDVHRIKPIVEEDGFSQGFIFLRAPQGEVAAYLSACDLGFLIRRTTLVNTVAQPVKVGEYLAAGVPVCVEGEVGGVTEKLLSYSAGISINISSKKSEDWSDDANRVLNFLKEKDGCEEKAKQLAKDYFLWETNVLRQRDYYQRVLENMRSMIHS